VAALLDVELPVPGVTTGTIRPELKSIAVISRVGGGNLDTTAGDLCITAGWGHGTNVVMPGTGRVIERAYTEEEHSKIQQSYEGSGLAADEAFDRLGETTCDIHLNDVAYWRNVPARVWDYRIGGYQVIKKLLSYREFKVLGRAVTPEEAREITTVSRRIASLLLLEPFLNTNYKTARDDAYQWSAQTVNSGT